MPSRVVAQHRTTRKSVLVSNGPKTMLGMLSIHKCLQLLAICASRRPWRTLAESDTRVSADPFEFVAHLSHSTIVSMLSVESARIRTPMP